MKYEYLVFNFIILAGPLFFGSLKKYYFIDKIKIAIISLLPIAIPFIIWDSIVTGSHWFFNSDYITGIKLFKLPIEEILFFITVPFACLFTWEMIIRKTSENKILRFEYIQYILFILPLGGIYFFILGKEYTGLVLIFLGITAFIDKISRANLLLQKRFYFYLMLVTFFTLIFNGYLTWRPVITYGEDYQIGFRIFTIPIEDFFYGFSLIIISTIIYSKTTLSEVSSRVVYGNKKTINDLHNKIIS